MPLVSIAASATNYNLADLLEAKHPGYQTSGWHMSIEALESNTDHILLGDSDLSDTEYDMELQPGNHYQWEADRDICYTSDKYIRQKAGGSSLNNKLAVRLEKM